MTTKLGIFVSHPVQYHAPIWRTLAQSPHLDVKVHFFSDHSIRGDIDPGFGVPVKWDTPILEGYESTFLQRDANTEKPFSVKMKDPVALLKREKFDWILIAGYMYTFERQLLRAARKLGVRVLMRGEFTDLKGKTPPLWKRITRELYLKWVYSHVDAFGCVGLQARQHLLKRGVPEARIFFSPYSVDTSSFDAQKQIDSRSQTRSRLGLSDDTFVFLFSGKLIPRKEIKLLVEAFAHVKHPERCALLILGDGEQREEVIQRGTELLQNRFLFQGFVNQSQLGQYFLAADAFVLPSKYEAWGLVVNEAMQFGLPLLLSDMIGSHKDLLHHNETGYLFQTGDVHDLARGLDKLMKDPQNAQRMGKNAEEVVKGYSTKISAQGLQEAIESLSKPA